jgi:hypothetical protein
LSYLSCLAREVICRLDRSANARINVHVASIVGLVDSEREARVEVELEVELAVFA